MATRYLYERRQLDESLSLLDRAEGVAEEALSHDSLEPSLDQALKSLLSDIMNDRACIKFAECHFAEARELYSKCLDLKKSMDSPSENELCLLTSNVGNAYANMGMLDESFAWLKKAFDMRQQLLQSVPDPDKFKDQLARDWGTLAGCLWLRGDFDLAWQYANYSTELCEQIYDKGNIVLAG